MVNKLKCENKIIWKSHNLMVLNLLLTESFNINVFPSAWWYHSGLTALRLWLWIPPGLLYIGKYFMVMLVDTFWERNKLVINKYFVVDSIATIVNPWKLEVNLWMDMDLLWACVITLASFVIINVLTSFKWL